MVHFVEKVVGLPLGEHSVEDALSYLVVELVGPLGELGSASKCLLVSEVEFETAKQHVVQVHKQVAAVGAFIWRVELITGG